MKHIKSIILLFLFNQFGSAQIDMINEGLKSCLQEDEFVFVNELFVELENYTFKGLNIANKDYKNLTTKFCEIETSGKFILKENSELGKLIIKGIKKEFWTYDQYDLKMPTINSNGDTVDIIPPKYSEYNPPSRESIEQVYINSKAAYISCSKDYTFHSALNVFLQQYETYKVSPSAVKLCSMLEFFKEEDYVLTSIKHYILLHCVCQRIIHENKYQEYFE